MNGMRATMSMGVLLVIAACAPTTPILTGVARPPIAVSEVTLYSTPPPVYQEIAVLTASNKSAFGTGGEKSVDKVVERLKEQAAQLGANGLVLEEFFDRQTASIGTGVGSDSYTHNGSVSVGVGGGIGIFKKTGKGRAIFVPPPGGGTS
jgi:hypothetical protein